MRLVVFLLCLLFLLDGTNRCDASFVFLGFDADEERFAVGLLEDYAANTQFFFTDNAWNGSSFSTGEGYLSFVPANTLAAGTILEFTEAGFSVVDGFGNTVSGSFASAGGNFDLSASSDQLYAFIGPNASTVATPLASIANATSGETLFGNTVDFTGSTFEGFDVIFYNGPTTIVGQLQDFIALTSNTVNWEGFDGSGSQGANWNPPSGTLSAVPEPTSLLLVGLAGAGGAIVARRRKAVAKSSSK